MELGLDIFCVEYILSWPFGQNHYYHYYYTLEPSFLSIFSVCL